MVPLLTHSAGLGLAVETIQPEFFTFSPEEEFATLHVGAIDAILCIELDVLPIEFARNLRCQHR